MTGPARVGRVALTPEAAELLRRLRAQHGALMFHQSGGCCDGSSPMCYPLGEFLTGDADVLLGELDVSNDPDSEPGNRTRDDTDRDPGATGPEDSAAANGFAVPVWMSRNQFEYWQHTHLTIDIVPGRGAGFSLEAPLGVRFLIRSRLLTDEEVHALDGR